MKYRTDLALESRDMAEESGIKLGDKDGIIQKEETVDEDIKITTIDIVSPKGEILLGKPCGRYITMEVDGIIEEKSGITRRAAEALAEELKKLIKFHYYLKVLVVGLGNLRVTPDSLGPHTISKVRITRHLFKIFQCDGDEEQANVAGISPGVTATTGIETAEIIEKVVKMTQPEVVIVVDSLAARNLDRVSTTIQISDAGISPGAGMGNRRKEINRDSLGTKVIAIGVPTVIDSATLIKEAMESANQDEDKTKAYLQSKDFDMIVTSTDIDVIIEKFSDIIAKAVNITLHPGINID